MRIFLDTNVLVSVTPRAGLCAELLERILTEPDCELLTGEVNLIELRAVLQRPVFNVSKRLIDEIENALRDQTIVARPARPARLPLRDPDDRWVLAPAIEGRADVLITGDKDLLDIADQSPVRILSPRELLNRFLGKPGIKFEPQ